MDIGTAIVVSTAMAILCPSLAMLFAIGIVVTLIVVAQPR